MGKTNRSFKFGKVYLFACTFFIGFSCSVSLAETSSEPAKQLFADTGVTTNYVEHGITQSQQGWALQSSVGYKMGQIAKIGVAGSSVQFPDNAENLNLRFFFGVKFDVTASNALLIRYDFNRYFQSGFRNGSIISLEDRFLGYHIGIEQNSNWEGLGNSATWFGFGKEFDLGSGWMMEGELGYTEVGTLGYKNYFDVRASVGDLVSDILLKISATTTSQPGQFAGRGGAFLFLSASIKFQ